MSEEMVQKLLPFESPLLKATDMVEAGYLIAESTPEPHGGALRAVMEAARDEITALHELWEELVSEGQKSNRKKLAVVADNE